MRSVRTLPFAIHFHGEEPLQKQLYSSVRSSILSGALARGTRLPSTRTLASELGVSRMTVTTAFEQLASEGYIEARIGSGSFVAATLPDEFLHAAQTAARSKSRAHVTLSKRGTVISQHAARKHWGDESPRAFRTGLPALDHFPFDTWRRISGRLIRRESAWLFGEAMSEGYRPLREAIATYLYSSRAVRCTPDQVIVVSGSQQALDLIARVLLDPGDEVWFEDPGYLGARHAFVAAEAKLIPVHVDERGLDVDAAIGRAPSARVAYITPSHQYPLGVTLDLERRLQLLDWARRSDAWIVEDDYDSEYRYSERPLASVQGLDEDGRVIYVGTFSKVLFPSMRIAYLVVPESVAGAFASARAVSGGYSPVLDQAIAAEFIQRGHFASHLRSMRSLYFERKQALLEALARDCPSLQPIPAAGGMHVATRFVEDHDDLAISARIHEAGIQAQPLSQFYLGRKKSSGLLFGFAAVSPREIRAAVAKMAPLLPKR